MILEGLLLLNANNQDVNTIVKRYQYNNLLGSASMELDQNGELISYEEYHAFGTSSMQMHQNHTNVSMKRYRYVGKERDSEKLCFHEHPN